MNPFKTTMLAIFTFLALSAALQAQTTYIIGVPCAMPIKTANTVLGAVVKLLDEGKAGDEVRVYDAWNSQLYGSFTIPNTSSQKARRIALKDEINAIVRALAATSSVRSVPPTQIRFPAFTKVVSANLRSGAGDVRVICFGSPYYADTSDKGFTFSDGFYPSDGYLLAESSKSIFGTKGKKDVLSGCAVHYCYLSKNNFTGTLDAGAVERFWHLYISEQGGVLSSFAASSDDVLRRAMSGVSDPVSKEVIDRTDTKIEMRKVGMPRKQGEKAQTESKNVPQAVTALPPSAQAPHLLVMIDGTASMGMRERLTKVASTVKTAVTTGASLCGEVKVGLIVYRGPGETDILPLTVVRRPQGNKPNEGMSAFLDFMEAKEVRVTDNSTASGFRMVSRMHPRNGIADVGSALRIGLSLLRGSAAKDAPLLVAVCGDQGPWELGGSSMIEPEERELAAALQEEMAEFLGGYSNAQVISIFTGSHQQINGTESAAFFESLASAAGSRGAFAQSPDALIAKALALFMKGANHSGGGDSGVAPLR